MLIANDNMPNCSAVLTIISSDFDHETDLNNLLPVPNKVTVSFNEINVVEMSKFSNLSIPARKR